MIRGLIFVVVGPAAAASASASGDQQFRYHQTTVGGQFTAKAVHQSAHDGNSQPGTLSARPSNEDDEPKAKDKYI